MKAAPLSDMNYGEERRRNKEQRAKNKEQRQVDMNMDRRDAKQIGVFVGKITKFLIVVKRR